MVTDAKMFVYCEAQRALASPMSDQQLAQALLDDILASIGAAENEYAVGDADHEAYNRERGIVREAAYRLAKLRDYEGAADLQNKPEST